jgi:hypothetical protein
LNIFRKEKDVLTLQCILTDEEKADYSSKLAQTVSDKRKKDGEMENFRTQYKAEITQFENAITLYAEKVNTGKEFRAIECSILFNFDNKTKTWIRKDTGEVAKDDIISESELQEEMELQKNK